MALLACQEPFGTDRHDLVGFRVAALSVPPADDGAVVVPHPALVVDGRTWSDDPPALVWRWIRDLDDEFGLADAVGPAPELVVPADRRTLLLVAVHGDEEERVVLEVARPPTTFAPPTGFVVEALPLALDALAGPELALAARQDLAGAPAEQIEPGGFARLRLDVGGDPLVRWMATAGTFFELDRQAADWAAGDVVLDDDEVEQATPLDAGTVTVVALALGAPGETAFRVFDLNVGDPGIGLRVGGRWLPSDPVGGEAVRGTLVADDDAPVGLRLAGAEAVTFAEAGDFGTPALACAVPRSGPFDPGWLLEGICARSDMAGAEVVVVPDAP